MAFPEEKTGIDTNVSAKRRRIMRAPLNLMQKERSSIPGNVKSCGIIEKIRLKNFLCHDSLEVTFSDQINLIQGRNGSGKSSVVAAVIAGLGGSSKKTDRGNTKNLIMHGKNEAIIEIHLQNRGVGSYKPELFGDSIIVERKLLISGSGSYKLKSGNGVIVSKRKEELMRILDCFNLCIDNPVLVLSQERAKSFLSTTNPRDLFKFFMLSTNLQQLKDDYSNMQCNLTVCERCIKEKKQNIPLHKNEVKEWENKVNSIRNLQQHRAKLMEFRREKAWAEVRNMEAKLQKVERESYIVNQKIEGVLKKVTSLTLKKEELNNDYRNSTVTLQSLAEKVSTFEAEKKATKSNLNAAKENLRQAFQQLQCCIYTKRNKEGDIETISKKLTTDHRQAQLIYQEKKDEISRQKKEIEDEMLKLQQFFDAERVHFSNLATLDDVEIEVCQMEKEKHVIVASLSSLERELQNLQSTGNRLILFGQSMPDIIRDINVAHENGHFQHCPIGPLGIHIRVREQQWAHIAEKVLGKFLTSFLVSSQSDCKQLRNIFHKYLRNEAFPGIIVSPHRNQVHDVERYEARSLNYFSLWSILETDDVQVANALLDQHEVETILLIPTSMEAGELLMNEQTVPQNCKQAYTLHGDLYYPDPSYRIYSGHGNKRVHFLQISLDQKKRDIEANIRETRKAVESSQIEYQEKRKYHNMMKVCHKESSVKIQKIQQTMKKLNQRSLELDNVDVPAPPDVVQLQKDLQETEAELFVINQKHDELQKEAKESEVVNKECKLKLKDLIIRQGDFLEESERLQHEHYNIKGKVLDIKKRIEVCNLQKKEMEQHLQTQMETSAAEIEQQLKVKLEALQGSSSSERINTRRDVETIERDLKILVSHIQLKEQEHGDLTVISATWREKKDHLLELEEEIEGQISFVTKLKETLTVRNASYDILQKFQEAFLKSSFESNIKSRSLLGQININFKKETLKILIKKDAPGVVGTELQSLQMMSGGEKSFATVSFILAMWDNVSSPVRILDEFDIFMDVVLRKQAVEMLVSSVKPEYQHILVTPLDYNLNSRAVTAFRIPSPERRRV